MKLERDLIDITTRKISTLNYFRIELTLHTEKDDYIIPIDNIKFFDNQRDYLNEVGERYFITFITGMGDFVYDIFPYRNNLEATIKLTTINGYGKELEHLERYKCVLNNIHTGMDIPGIMTSSKEVLNQGEIFSVNIECISRTLESILYIPTSLDVLNSNIEDALYFGVHNALVKSRPMVDGASVELTYDVEKPSNEMIYSKISSLIKSPTGIEVMNLPTFLQKEYGVYNGGIGTFLQKTYINEKESKDVYYVYPIMGFRSDTKERYKLIIFIAPNGKYDLSEGTFYRDGDILKMVVTSDSVHTDRGEDEIRSSGTEVVSIHPKSIVNRSNLSTDGEKEVRYDRNNMSRENQINKTSDGTKNIRYVGVKDNLYVERSDIMIANGIGFDLTWMNGCYLDLYPGMPVEIIREHNENISRYKGRLINSYMSYDKVRGSSIVRLKVLAEKILPEEK